MIQENGLEKGQSLAIITLGFGGPESKKVFIREELFARVNENATIDYRG
jgi:hypothetical protein